MIKRDLIHIIQKQLKKGKSLFVLGPRQVGKTTLAKDLRTDLELNLATSSERLKYEKSPEILSQKALSFKKKPLIYIDEVQKVPALFGEIQVLADQQKAQFFLTGSSARKLKMQSDQNLIPGRLINLRLDALSLHELKIPIAEALSFGQLPRIVKESDSEQKDLELRSYVENYLDEEIRKETRIRQMAPFIRFIELAAIQSGKVTNFTEISKELGPTVATIQSYYQILEDTLIVDRIDPYLKNASRKKLTKSSKYLFFDLGVRRVSAGEARTFLPERKGDLFEHLVGNEILKWTRANANGAKLYFWRDPDGPEVDWVLEFQGRLLPIEVKIKSNPKTSDTKHLHIFMSEYAKAKKGIVVCTTEQRFSLAEKIEAISIFALHRFLDEWSST